MEFIVTLDISDTTIYQVSALGFYSGLGIRVEDIARVMVTAVPCGISGHKYQDLTGDGPDIYDTPLPGWTINHYDADGAWLAETTTSGEAEDLGSYSFTGLAAGTYEVHEVMQPNWEQTFPSRGGTVGFFTVILDLNGSAVASDVDFYNRLPSNLGRMTGGGSIFDLGFVQSSEDIRGRKGGRGSGGRITHGFQLRCDLSLPSRLQINWDTGNSFHLTELTVAECDYDLEGFPQFYGEGIGKCNNGEDLISVTFTFSDQGPGYQDLADIIVQCYEWTSVIVGDYYEVTTEGGEVSIESDHRGRNNLDRGNHQAHDWDAGGPAGADVQAFVETALEEVTTVTIKPAA